MAKWHEQLCVYGIHVFLPLLYGNSFALFHIMRIAHLTYCPMAVRRNTLVLVFKYWPTKILLKMCLKILFNYLEVHIGHSWLRKLLSQLNTFLASCSALIETDNWKVQTTKYSRLQDSEGLSISLTGYTYSSCCDHLQGERKLTSTYRISASIEIRVLKRHWYTHVHNSTTENTQKVEAIQCTSTDEW